MPTPGRFVPVEPIAAGTGPLLRPLESGTAAPPTTTSSRTTRNEPLGGTAIEYSLDTRRARTEVRAQVAQARLLESLVKEASSPAASTRTSAGPCSSCWCRWSSRRSWRTRARRRSCSTRARLASRGSCWTTRAGRGTTSGRGPSSRELLRKFKTETFRAQVSDASAGAPILVIGEPASPPDYPPLPGAYREAMAVYELPLGARRRHRLEGDEDHGGSRRPAGAGRPHGRRRPARAELARRPRRRPRRAARDERRHPVASCCPTGRSSARRKSTPCGWCRSWCS